MVPPLSSTGQAKRYTAAPASSRIVPVTLSADGAVLGARIRTLDPQRPQATALAWRDARLLAVGDDAEVREHSGARTEVIDGTGLSIVPGLVDSHIHPFYGRCRRAGSPCGTPARSTRCARGLAEERRRCGPDTWLLGHSVRYEPFHDSGIRADAIADAVGESPAIIGFFDGHTALASAPGARAGGRHRSARVQRSSPRSWWIPTAARPARCWRTRAMDLVRGDRAGLDGGRAARRVRRDVPPPQPRRAHRVHAMLGDPQLLDACRALEARGDLTARTLMPMHQAPDISDEEVEAHLASSASTGALGARARRSSSSTACSTRAPRGWSTRARAASTPSPFWPSVDALRGARRALHARRVQRDHPRRRRRSGARRARRLRGRRPAHRGKHRSSTSRR
jgi:hypothetical protein